MSGCFERDKSCVECEEDCYDKQLHGWYGALQRQLQRSQYQMRYSKSLQATIWILLLVFLIGKLLSSIRGLTCILETNGYVFVIAVVVAVHRM